MVLQGTNLVSLLQLLLSGCGSDLVGDTSVHLFVQNGSGRGAACRANTYTKCLVKLCFLDHFVWDYY